MMPRANSTIVTVMVLAVTACGGGSGSLTPTAPSSPSSFLAGTWSGTVTIQVNPDDPGAAPSSSATTTWTFEVVPQTNLQTFRATVRSEHAWLPISTIATTALVPGNMPPAQISTQGGYDSPRGCRGTFGSFGTANPTRIDADFTGVDCYQTTFAGQIVLTKN
jgi:hypothetical protein